MESLMFLPASGPSEAASAAGFRFGDRGTHTSRTMMLDELTSVLFAAPQASDRRSYVTAIIDENCLAKPTAATRRSTRQRLSELYALDPACPVFRVMRRLWSVDEAGRPLLALLASLARDPLLLASAPPVLRLPEGAEFQRGAVRDALRAVTGERLGDAVLDKVVRNVASSWTQAGHLEGRTFKFRRRVAATAASLAFALYLGHAAGFRGHELLTSGWVVALDCTPPRAEALALEAKRLGLIDLRKADDVLELGLGRLDPLSGRR